jgi:penicillin-binding protein 2
MIFNLDTNTGIEIEEEKSFFPDTSWYIRRYGSHWPHGVLLNLAIGQGEILLTPIRLATIYAEVLTGKKITPHLIKRNLKSESLAIDKKTLDFIHEALKGVVEEGTGRVVSSFLKEAGGKTGTAQNPHGEDHSLFVGFTPANNPQFLVCVIVENAGHGASVAAPVAGKIMSLYRRRYGQKA